MIPYCPGAPSVVSPPLASATGAASSECSLSLFISQSTKLATYKIKGM
ncbi:unnamed protein product [Staurois parvus]|uniref:Uncharacterized protein n=1 Tax=Staurois parvus TaxID=386267 RepID=A0ABN9HRK1_9NEOB|nr:unnamed protein product [Staurois parvus]